MDGWRKEGGRASVLRTLRTAPALCAKSPWNLNVRRRPGQSATDCPGDQLRGGRKLDSGIKEAGLRRGTCR
jgi:hypothetical protein